MKITYSDGKAKLTRQSVSNLSTFSGKIDIENRKIGGKYLLKDAAIIQLISSEDSNVATCELLDFDNLTAKELAKGQIINAVSANAFGDIAILYVKNFENTYDYGVVTGFEKSNDTIMGYKIFDGEKTSTYMIGNSARITTTVGSGVGLKSENGSLSNIISLTKIDSASKIGAVEGSRIMLDSIIYKMDDEVVIADITSPL